MKLINQHNQNNDNEKEIRLKLTKHYGNIDVVVCDEEGNKEERGHLVTFKQKEDELAMHKNKRVDEKLPIKTDKEGKIKEI